MPGRRTKDGVPPGEQLLGPRLGRRSHNDRDAAAIVRRDGQQPALLHHDAVGHSARRLHSAINNVAPRLVDLLRWRRAQDLVGHERRTVPSESFLDAVEGLDESLNGCGGADHGLGARTWRCIAPAVHHPNRATVLVHGALRAELAGTSRLHVPNARTVDFEGSAEQLARIGLERIIARSQQRRYLLSRRRRGRLFEAADGTQ
mmetsp:Transcript_7402/g.21897  ORF Transcript_7402/g.21897 Transcript_7402/m.21897 type:complete len:203 (+) Transcript_7402:407-1015(+)